MSIRRDYAVMGKPRLTASMKAVRLYDDSRVMADGWCTMTVTDNMNNKHQLSFLVINTKQNSLLLMNICFDLRLIKISETVHLVSEEPLENILMGYENVSGKWMLTWIIRTRGRPDYHTSPGETTDNSSFDEG